MSELSSAKLNKNKIDMNHGFMKSIIRNQHDRDNYDKEMKLMAEHPATKTKPRKADAPVYQPPNQRANAHFEFHKDMKWPLFRVEFEDEEGISHIFDVFDDSNLRSLAQSLGKDVGLPQKLVEALHYKLTMEFAARKPEPRNQNS